MGRRKAEAEQVKRKRGRPKKQKQLITPVQDDMVVVKPVDPEREKRIRKYYALLNGIIERSETHPYELVDAFDLLRCILEETDAWMNGDLESDPETLNKVLDYSKRIRIGAAKWLVNPEYSCEDAEKLYRRTLLFEAPYCFDSYCRYLEFDRPKQKKFYEPRRKMLKPLADEMERLAKGELDLLSISMPPGTGKSTLAIFFLTWCGGRDPEKTILGGSHSNSFLRGVYDELLRIISGNGGEYLFDDVFPSVPLCNTNAKDMRIDLQRRKRFETFEFSSIGSGNAGKVRASGLLYCDDLVDGIETAMSKERLDKLWQQYYTDLRQRKIGNAKELIISTRWSIWDHIGRLEMQYADDPRSKFIVVPALDENDESQFDYPYNLGFTTEFYHKQREIMDAPSWKALYMGEPIEREGVLFAPDELKRYFMLPDGQPDAIIAVCDTKDSGPDYYCMPIAYQFGNEYYIEKILCDNGKPEVVEERIIQELVTRKVKSCRFESNRGASRNAEAIQKEVRKRGGITNITLKWNESNKDARIIHDSPFIKANFLFKDESEYDQEYRKAMAFLTGYTMGISHKHRHDDVPDSLSMLAEYIQSFENTHATVVARWF